MTYVIDRYPCEESPRLGAMILDPTPESVPRARRWFRKFIAPYNPACSVDDCTLMISELVTNAILYGRSEGEWRVRVEWFRDATSLRVEVHNPASRRVFACAGRMPRTRTGADCSWSTPSPSPGTPGPAASGERWSPS